MPDALHGLFERQAQCGVANLGDLSVDIPFLQRPRQLFPRDQQYPEPFGHVLQEVVQSGGRLPGRRDFLALIDDEQGVGLVGGARQDRRRLLRCPGRLQRLPHGVHGVTRERAKRGSQVEDET